MDGSSEEAVRSGLMQKSMMMMMMILVIRDDDDDLQVRASPRSSLHKLPSEINQSRCLCYHLLLRLLLRLVVRLLLLMLLGPR